MAPTNLLRTLWRNCWALYRKLFSEIPHKLTLLCNRLFVMLSLEFLRENLWNLRLHLFLTSVSEPLILKEKKIWKPKTSGTFKFPCNLSSRMSRFEKSLYISGVNTKKVETHLIKLMLSNFSNSSRICLYLLSFQSSLSTSDLLQNCPPRLTGGPRAGIPTPRPRTT